MDGRIPNTIPINIENATLRMIAGTDIDTGVAVTREMTCDRNIRIAFIIGAVPLVTASSFLFQLALNPAPGLSDES